MIALNASATARFSFLAVPPTHAALASRLIMYQQGTFAIIGFTLNYWYGNVDGGGNFVVNANAGTHIITIPSPNSTFVIPAAIITLVMANLFGAGVAPNPLDPTTSVVVLAKKAGDHKIIDLDAVVAFLDPALAGTVV